MLTVLVSVSILLTVITSVLVSISIVRKTNSSVLVSISTVPFVSRHMLIWPLALCTSHRRRRSRRSRHRRSRHRRHRRHSQRRHRSRHRHRSRYRHCHALAAVAADTTVTVVAAVVSVAAAVTGSQPPPPPSPTPVKQPQTSPAPFDLQLPLAPEPRWLPGAWDLDRGGSLDDLAAIFCEAQAPDNLVAVPPLPPSSLTPPLSQPSQPPSLSQQQPSQPSSPQPSPALIEPPRLQTPASHEPPAPIVRRSLRRIMCRPSSRSLRSRCYHRAHAACGTARPIAPPPRSSLMWPRARARSDVHALGCQGHAAPHFSSYSLLTSGS